MTPMVENKMIGTLRDCNIIQIRKKTKKTMNKIRLEDLWYKTIELYNMANILDGNCQVKWDYYWNRYSLTHIHKHTHEQTDMVNGIQSVIDIKSNWKGSLN